ncbi:T9SS type B sorting domain-containing protein [Winogradskyella forsetii]|uniref:T9SS type B sorting domain-containing protein n=1 Tax=Winogradskyella forsetii TaxID=2686077 RepID=UPI0015BE1939|nr:choice-of-anchor L domain-containing protein [Winogradskyella forsetii]
MKKKSIYLFLLLFAHVFYLHAQQISTDNSLQPNALIQNIIGTGCATASNVSSAVNGSVNGIVSFGSFDSGTTNFPLQNGLVLSTGSVSAAANTFVNDDLSEGNIDWSTDQDLIDVLGIDQTLNATSIEFDFESANSFVSFKYLFASDEYQQEYPCNFKDVFAIFIKRAGTMEPYVNIALIPDTTTEVSTNTIHPNIAGFCEAQNGDFFRGYNIGNTNFNGHTEVLTARADIIPNETYHIKLVIADHIDQRFDSAVFIEAEGFGNSIDLGPDQSICGSDLILDTNFDNTSASIQWLLNGNPIPGENSPTLQVIQTGTYSVEITIPSTANNCILTDEIEVEVIPFQQAAPIEDYTACDPAPSDGIYDFNFQDLKNEEIYSNLPSNDYTISYHLTQDDAQSDVNAITGNYQNTEETETIFVRIESTNGDCLQIGNFNIYVNELPSSADFSIFICNENFADPGFSNINMLNNVMADGELNRTVTYFINESDAIEGINAITDFPDFSTQPPYMVARIEISDASSQCFSLGYIYFDYISPPELFTNTLILDACTDPNIEETIDGVSYTYNNIPIFFDIEGYFEIIETSIFPGSSVRVAALLGLGNPRSYTLNEQSTFTIPLAVSFDNGNCYSPVTLKLYKNYLHEVIGEENTIETCDDDSNNGIENFNFDVIRQELLENIDEDYSANLFIDYYESELDRTNDLNAIDQSLPFSVNTYDELFIEAYYSFNGVVACSINSKINLQVSPALNLNPISIDYCGSTDPNTNQTNIILETASKSVFEDIVNNYGIEVSLEYYETFENAETQENELIEMYSLLQGQNLYIRATNTITGCYDITSLELNVYTILEDPNLEPIIICDEDQNLFATVNLENVLQNFSGNTNDIDFTFYNSFSDAIDEFHDFLSIPNPTNYTTNSKEIFLRAEIESLECFTILNFEILIYADPQLSTISDYINCQINPNASSSFLFVDKDPNIIDNQSGMQVLYFETEDNAINRVNPIDKNAPYFPDSNPQTVYVRLENETENGCFKVAPMQIEVRQAPIYNSPTDVFECDINNNGLATTDLNQKIIEISTGSPTNLDITFHLSPLNAEVGANEIPLNFTAASNPQLIYTRIENTDSGCYEIQTFNINTLALPEVTYGQSLINCADNYNYELEWDLTDIELEILEGRQYNIAFSYFESEEDIVSDSAITTPTAYLNTSNMQTIFAKITNATTGCFDVVPFDLIINSPPQINDFETYNICENTENQVDLLDINEILLDNTFNVLVSYHENEADAQANENPLNSNYLYSSSTETLFVRAEFSTTHCYTVYPFQLVVNPLPMANQPSDLIACDDDFDGLLEFDLTLQNASILGNQNPEDFSITFHNSESNAMEGNDPIATDYIASNNETFYVRLENNSTGCFAITQFTAIINNLPPISIEDQVLCMDYLPLIVSAETNNPEYSYLWSTNVTTPQIEIFEVGSYSLTVTNEFGCEYSSSFNVTESQAAEIDIIETLDFSDPNNITVTISGIGDYLYQLDDFEPQESNVFQNVAMGYHTVTIIDLNGCSDTTKEVLVVDIPKFFTPNSDGTNDTWHIVGIETLPGTSINIYDRYGKLITRLNSNSSGWNGKYNGEKMPSSDYWYVADVKGDSIAFQVKGHFTLKR